MPHVVELFDSEAHKLLYRNEFKTQPEAKEYKETLLKFLRRGGRVKREQKMISVYDHTGKCMFDMEYVSSAKAKLAKENLGALLKTERFVVTIQEYADI